jgi:hypothetical protein
MAKHPSGFYHGASLAALTKLGIKKGYALAGCDSMGVNAFFVRRDVGRKKIPELDVREAYFPNHRRLQVMSTEEQFGRIAQMPFSEI